MLSKQGLRLVQDLRHFDGMGAFPYLTASVIGQPKGCPEVLDGGQGLFQVFVHGQIMYQQIILDKPPVRVFNVPTLNHSLGETK